MFNKSLWSTGECVSVREEGCGLDGPGSRRCWPGKVPSVKSKKHYDPPRDREDSFILRE